MNKLLMGIALITLALAAGGCGIFGNGRTYDGSTAYSEAHPDQAQPMPYMDPDSQYHSDDK
jgi:hypothetical protein